MRGRWSVEGDETREIGRVSWKKTVDEGALKTNVRPLSFTVGEMGCQWRFGAGIT